MGFSLRFRQVNIRGLIAMVATLAIVFWLARFFWELDPVHRGGRLLRDSRPTERIRGLQAITGAPGVADDPSQASAALPGVLRAVADEDARVRAEAVRCVMTLVGSLTTHPAASPGTDFSAQATSAIYILTDALRDDDPIVRAEAANALGMLDPASGFATPQLLDTFEDANPGVRRAVVIALSRMTSLINLSDPLPVIENHQDSDPDVRIAILDALESMYKIRRGPPSSRVSVGAGIPPQYLLAGLEDSDRRVRAKCVTLLKPFGLLRGLPEPVPGGLRRLSRSQKAKALHASLEALSNDAIHVRLAAAECAFATVDAGQADAVPALASNLAREKDPGVSLAIAHVLARIGSDEAITALCDALDDPRNRAILPLALAAAPFGGSRSEKVIRRLTPLLDDESPTVRIEALRAFAAFGRRALDVLPRIAHMIYSDGDAKVREAANLTRNAITAPTNVHDGVR